MMNAAHKILAQATGPGLDVAHVAAILEDELGFTQTITALRKCDKTLEQLGASVNEREFIVAAIARLEGSESSAPADSVIGKAP
jgi:hypothetical protein